MKLRTLWKMRSVPLASGLSEADLKRMRKTYRNVGDTGGILLVDTVLRLEAALAEAAVTERERLADIVTREFLDDETWDQAWGSGYNAASLDVIDLLKTGNALPTEEYAASIASRSRGDEIHDRLIGG